MRDDEFDRLVNDELDGVATPDEKAALARKLAESETARARYQEIQAVFGMLDKMESVDPPPSLRGNVLRVVESRARAKAEQPGWRGFLGVVLGRHPGLGIGYAFAAGAVVGALVLGVGTGFFERHGFGNSEIGGTMLPPGGADHRAGVVRLEVKGVQVSGEALAQGPRGVVARLEVRAAGPFEAHLNFDAEHYAVQLLRRVEPSGGRLELRRGDLILGDTGDGRFEVVFRATGAELPPLGLSIRTAEGSAEGLLTPRQPG